MAKKDAVVVGNNVQSYQEGSIIWFGVDLSVSGTQTEGSKGVDRQGNAKRPNEMVGSTRSFTPIGEGSLLLHYTRPMKVEDVRKARALAELDDEDASVEKALAILKANNVDTSGIKA